MLTKTSHSIIPNSILHASTKFEELDGTTLELWAFTVSHNTLLLRSSGTPKGYGSIRFGRTLCMNLTPVMSQVHLRMATEAENENFRLQLPARLVDYAGIEFEDTQFSLQNGRCIIECKEGVFSVWAGLLLIDWMNDPDIGLGQEANKQEISFWKMNCPLWDGGQPISEL